MDTHSYYLQNLLNNLYRIGERPNDISLICSEGIYMKEGSQKKNKLNDLILFYYDDSVSLIELKGHRNKRGRAIEQLRSGYELVKKLGFDKIRGKVVYYLGRSNYEYENISLISPHNYDLFKDET